MGILTMSEIESSLRFLLKKYHGEYAILFGSYARGEATPASDLDVIVAGGKDFLPKSIFSLAEELREMIGRDADVFELREVNAGTPFYRSIMREGIKIV